LDKAVFYHPLNDVWEYKVPSTAWTKSSGSLAGSGKVGKALSREDIAADVSGDTGDYASAAAATKVAFCGWFTKPSSTPSQTAAPTVGTPIGDAATSCSGTGVNGATVEVFVDDVSVGNADAVVSGGTWAKTGMSALSIGDVVSSKQTEPGKLQGAESNEVTVTLADTFSVGGARDESTDTRMLGYYDSGDMKLEVWRYNPTQRSEGPVTLVSGATKIAVGGCADGTIGEWMVGYRDSSGDLKLEVWRSNPTQRREGPVTLASGGSELSIGGCANGNINQWLIAYRDSSGDIQLEVWRSDSLSKMEGPTALGVAATEFSVGGCAHSYNNWGIWVLGYRDMSGNLKLEAWRNDSLAKTESAVALATNATELTIGGEAGGSGTWGYWMIGYRNSSGDLKLEVWRNDSLSQSEGPTTAAAGATKMELGGAVDAAADVWQMMYRDSSGDLQVEAWRSDSMAKVEGPVAV